MKLPSLAAAGFLAALCLIQTGCVVDSVGVYSSGPGYVAPAYVNTWGGSGYYNGAVYRGPGWNNNSYYRNNRGGYASWNNNSGYARGRRGSSASWNNGSGNYNGWRGGSASWNNGSGSWDGPRGGSGNWHR